MKKVFSILIVIIGCQLLVAQSNDDILMTIGDEDITADEFLRIYNKNSSITLEEKKSVDEYLDLFINYKLKVIEAENLGYDTLSSFKKEMEGYTKQLAKPYLTDNTIQDSLVKEAYDHYVEEVNASHILLRLNKEALPKDTARVYNKIMEIREEILNGKDWNQAIDEHSHNPDDKIGGDLGWFGGMRMVYPFEKAAYNTPVGEISMPVRTMYGYHLIKVNGRRPNRGEVEARHIMTVVPRNNSDVEEEAAKKKIEKAWDALQHGADWDSITRQYSEHRSTFSNGGKIGWIKSGSAPEIILDSCFSLKPGEYSEPFRSQYGYHIVKVDSIKPVMSFEEVKDDLTTQVKKNGDLTAITNEQRLERIKKQEGYTFNEENLKALYGVIDTTLYQGEWDPEEAADMQEVVFTIGDSAYTQYDVAKSVASRHLTYRGIPLSQSIRKRAMSFVDEKILAYEIAQLPKKYPEYRYLLEEYHDGILLFNLTEDMVWRKAVEDSTGLEAFYEALPKKYEWEERIALSKYSYADSLLTDKLIKIARKRIKKGLDENAVSALVCGQDTLPCVSISEMKYEKGDNAVADSLNWEKGTYLVSKDKDNIVLYYVDAILPPQEKKLQDARGLYTADYQSQLEKEWIAKLREKYTITIHEDVLDAIREKESAN